MQAQIIDGKQTAAALLADIQSQVEERARNGGSQPGLAMVLAGENSASQVYVRNKQKSCDRCGIRSLLHRLPESTSQSALLDLVDELNADTRVHGILVQLPLPPQIDSDAIIERIAPNKDVDGFHPHNIGRLAQARPGFRPCTPRGIMTLLQRYDINPEGMDALVLGRSNIVGRPMALELLNVGATVTICHSRTRALSEKVARADLVVAAVGRAQFVRGDWIKSGAVVVDVGINRGKDGRLVGDVDFDGARRQAAWITPVPGGVGPMTVATLLQNTLEAAAAGDS